MDNSIILFDFEYTAWEGSKDRKWSEPWEHREIIQIAAVRIEADREAAETGYFDMLVRPTHNPLLSSYITALTGIQQPEIDSRGIGFAEALSTFREFCEHGRLPLFCYGDDPAVLAENCQLNGLEPVPFPAGMHDIRVIFERAGIDTRRYTSGTVHQAVGADFHHAPHNALNDVRSLAATIRQLARLGQIETCWFAAGASFCGSS